VTLTRGLERSRLYTISLANGATTLIGDVNYNRSLIGIASRRSDGRLAPGAPGTARFAFRVVVSITGQAGRPAAHRDEDT
jgi:hypothetical protein